MFCTNGVIILLDTIKLLLNIGQREGVKTAGKEKDYWNGYFMIVFVIMDALL